jgi:ketopantoate hydroxymethyltransferase
VRNFMEGAGTNQQALVNYVQAVREVSYPAPEHEF